MSQRLTVAVDSAGPGHAASVRGVLASLPGRFAEGPERGADIAVVSGDDEGWEERAGQAVTTASALVLAGTAHVESAALTRLATAAAAASVTLTLDTGYACAPGWLSAVPALRAHAMQSAVIDGVAVVGGSAGFPAGLADLRKALIDQLLLVCALRDDLSGLRPLHVCASSYVVGGDLAGVPVTLSGAVSATSGYLQLDLASTDVRWTARFESEYLAQPACVSVFRADGKHARQASYESGHRIFWLNLHAALTDDVPLLVPVERLLGCIAAADTALATS